MTTTAQRAFHPLLCKEGATIQMENGDVAVVCKVPEGWQLFVDGRPHAIPTKSKHVLDCIVYSYPSEEI